MRCLLALLALGLMLSANTCYAQLYTAQDTIKNASITDVTGWALTDSLVGYYGDNVTTVGDLGNLIWYENDPPKKHDTLKEYIISIKEKCDSLMVERWKFAVEYDGVKYYEKAWTVDSVKCYPDTTWANKVAVYLTPDELDKLLRMVR